MASTVPGMAEKGWTAQAGAAAGIAAGAGAAQLGLGYGLGVIEWPSVATASDSTWLNSLGWATWITASATVLGAVIAGRMRADRPGPWRTLWRVALATAAALGALVSVALVALPARSAVRPNGLFDHSPQLVAVGYALIGLVTGVVVAFWAISSAPVAANLLGTAAWLWALAVAGVGAELVTHREMQTYLTSWQFAETQTPIRYGGIYWPSAALTLVAAFLIGLILAWPAARRGRLGLGTATSGAVGPLLVAISFLSLAPLLTEAAGPLQSAYLIAPYAVLAGLAGSALTVSLSRGRGSGQAVETTDEPLPLPAGVTPDEGPAIGTAVATTPVRAVPAQAEPTSAPSRPTSSSAQSASRTAASAQPSSRTAPPSQPTSSSARTASQPTSSSGRTAAAPVSSSSVPLPASAHVSASVQPTQVSAAARPTPTPVSTSARPVPTQTRPAPSPTPLTAAPAEKAPAKPAKRAKFTADEEPYAPDLSEEEGFGRRRWLFFGKRRPATDASEITDAAKTPAEAAESEPKGRGRKSRAAKATEAETTQVTEKSEKSGAMAKASAASGAAGATTSAAGLAGGAAGAKPATSGSGDAKPATSGSASARPATSGSSGARPAAPKPAAPKPAPPKPATDDGIGDPELAAAARPTKNAAKRAAARKEASPRSTITPPPANPPIARINPKD